MNKITNSAIVEIRVEPTILADLLEFFRSRGIEISTRSELGRQCIVLLHKILVENDEIMPISSVAEALEIFMKYGMKPPTKSGKTLDAFAHSIKLEKTMPSQQNLADRARELLKARK